IRFHDNSPRQMLTRIAMRRYPWMFCLTGELMHKVIPGLAPGIQPAAYSAAGGEIDPGDKHRDGKERSSQPISSLDLILLQAANAWQRPAAVGDGDAYHYLIGARGIGHAHLDGVEVRAHVGRILVAERYVDGG